MKQFYKKIQNNYKNLILFLIEQLFLKLHINQQIKLFHIVISNQLSLITNKEEEKLLKKNLKKIKSHKTNIA